MKGVRYKMGENGSFIFVCSLKDLSLYDFDIVLMGVFVGGFMSGGFLS